jgi:hypothetical protein
MQRRAFVIALVIGTVLQVAMVVAGHFGRDIQNFYMWGGLGFSLVAGIIYGRLSLGAWLPALLLGGVAGAVCGLIGIFISYILGDVPAELMLFGTIGSLVSGAFGGAVGKLTTGLRANASA